MHHLKGKLLNKLMSKKLPKLLFFLNNNIFKILILFFYFKNGWCHEQWLLTSKEIATLNSRSKSYIFTHFNVFNVAALFLCVLIILSWIWINRIFPAKYELTEIKLKWSTIAIRTTTGLMLILSSLGLLPKVDVPYFSATLFAPDLLINDLSPYWNWLSWAEFIIGICLTFGVFMTFSSLSLLVLIFVSVILFGKSMLQYLGFYLGIAIFLIIQSIHPQKRSYLKISNERSFIVLQSLTGLNLIFSAISIKFLHPDMDSTILIQRDAYTFWLPHDYFIFVMLLVEIMFGIFILLGFRLRIIAMFLLFIFIFMSFNLRENLLAHCFIYGILIAFIITNGMPGVIFGRNTMKSILTMRK